MPDGDDGKVKKIQFDLHIHTNRYSGCSIADPIEVIRRAKSVGLDGIALTEHNIRWRDDDIEELLANSCVDDILVIAGEETACYSPTGKFQGEFLVFGYPKSLGSSKSVDQVIELVHGAGGVVIAAHPYKRLDTGDGYYGCGDAILELGVDGLEVEHPSYDDGNRQRARQVMETLGIAGIGCSDSHDLHSIGICRTVFSKSITNIKALCDEIRAGNVMALNTKEEYQAERG